MKIGVITTSYPRREGDFAGAFVQTRVRELLAQGHSVDVIAAGELGPADGDNETGSPPRSPGLRVTRICLPGAGGDTVPLFYGPGAPEALEAGYAATWIEAAGYCAALCERIRAWSGSWDEAHAHWLVPSALLARVVGGVGAARLPVRAHAHSGDVALLERVPGGRMLARWLAAHLAEIRFVSEDLMRRFERLVAGRIGAHCRVVPAADIPRPRSQAKAEMAQTIPGSRRVPDTAAAPRQRTVLSVGRLVPIKGFDVLVKAQALAWARGSGLGSGQPPTPTLVILGDGPERARLTRLAARLAVPLRLPGFVPQPEVARWMTAADLYVQPSRSLPNGRTEGLPVATLEAMAHGLSVVASDSGGLVELPIHDPRVRLFPAGDYRALSHLLA